MEVGVYKVYLWNGKDLFLEAPNGSFIVKSFSELSEEMRERLNSDVEGEIADREVEVDIKGRLVPVLTLAEIAADRLKKQEIAKVRGDIAAIEAAGENIPDYAMVKLKALRKKLATLIPRGDPTAVTQEQQRANESIIREDFDVKKSGYR
jgi:hypothetical protein